MHPRDFMDLRLHNDMKTDTVMLVRCRELCTVSIPRVIVGYGGLVDSPSHHHFLPMTGFYFQAETSAHVVQSLYRYSIAQVGGYSFRAT